MCCRSAASPAADPYLGLLASTYGAAGRATEGLAVVAKASAMSRATGVQYWDAEIERLGGVLTADPREAEARLGTIRIARAQGARSLELRASTSLARLLRDAGRDEEARARLSPVYQQLDEGAATADLRDARALLDELGAPSSSGGRRVRRRPS